jgi:hypothetical protein
VFILGEGAAGAMGEIERRKFTAEEGVSAFVLIWNEYLIDKVDS